MNISCSVRANCRTINSHSGGQLLYKIAETEYKQRGKLSHEQDKPRDLLTESVENGEETSGGKDINERERSYSWCDILCSLALSIP